MDANNLLEVLLQQTTIDSEQVQQVYDQLPENADVIDFRNALIDQGTLSYAKVMTLFVENSLVPKGQSLLQRLDKARQQRTHFEPERHEAKFHVKEDDTLVENIALDAGSIPVAIPKPNLKTMTFSSSDEQQAVVLAVEMALMNEMNESEIILLEVIESFGKSVPAVYTLCWLYLCSNHSERVEYWANYLLKETNDNSLLLEMLTLAEQVQSKHLLASAHLQRLLQEKQVKPIWYLLLAYSLEKSNCHREAIENYSIYAAIAKDSKLKEVAKQHLNELTAS